MSKQITIRAIAARTGAGKSTVSLALRKSPLLLPETGERIRAAAEEMGWRPNPAVSAWMAHRRSSKPERGGQQIVFLNVFRDQRFWRKRQASHGSCSAWSVGPKRWVTVLKRSSPQRQR
jgi:LacI family transcriptional regulator